MPAKTPAEAFETYANSLKAVLGCVTREFLARQTIASRPDHSEFPLQKVFFVRDPVRLKTAGLAFSFSQYFRIGRCDDRGGYRVRTESYVYEILNGETGHEILAFHWEPKAPNSKFTIPHMHIGFALRDISQPFDHILNNKAHVPSGRVPLEDIVSFLISGLQVSPLHTCWEGVLATERRAFVDQKTW